MVCQYITFASANPKISNSDYLVGVYKDIVCLEIPVKHTAAMLK